MYIVTTSTRYLVVSMYSQVKMSADRTIAAMTLVVTIEYESLVGPHSKEGKNLVLTRFFLSLDVVLLAFRKFMTRAY